jgi:hypothetical protein
MVEFPGFSGQTVAFRFLRRSDAEVQHQIPGRVRSTYEFIKAHRDRYSVQMLCRVFEVAVSRYYNWLKQPISNHAQEDARLLRLRVLGLRKEPCQLFTCRSPESDRQPRLILWLIAGQDNSCWLRSSSRFDLSP